MKRLGKYELREEIGRGGFGVVHLAHDISLDVPRALKILHPILNSDPAFIQRFRREARVVARLRHPNIIPVYDLGQEEGWMYLVMEYMSGGSLKARIGKGPIPFADAVRILGQIGAGLAFAHEQDIIHRDVKPGNILFDAHGIAEIGDFGFARSLMDADTSTTLSLTGGALGTPAYMAPEAWDGYGWTQAADLYSLACVFVEMLTGRVLFDSNSPVQAMKKHVIDGPNLPARWPDGVPDEIDTVLIKALAKDPEDRYPGVRTFVREIQAMASGRTAQAPAEAPSHPVNESVSEAGSPAPEPEESVVLEGRSTHPPTPDQPIDKENKAVWRNISLPQFKKKPDGMSAVPAHNRWWALPALLAPGTVLLLIFRILPLIATFMYSLQARYLFHLDIDFIGLEQYARVLASPSDRKAYLNMLLLLAARLTAILCVWWLLRRAWKQAARPPVWLVMAASAALPFLLTVGWTLSVFILKVRGAPLNWLFYETGDFGRYIFIVSFDFIRTSAVASGIGLFLYTLVQKGLPPGSKQGEQVFRQMRNLALVAGAATALQAYDPVILSSSNVFQLPASRILSYQFNQLNLGLGSAVASIQIILLLVCVWLAARIWTRSRLDIGYTKPSVTAAPVSGHSRLLTSLLAFIWLAALLPYAGMLLIYWRFNWGSICQATARFYWCDWSWIEYFTNNLAIPGLLVWLIQIPVTVMAAYALAVKSRRGHPVRTFALPLLAIAAFTGEIVILGAITMGFRTIDPETMLRRSYYPFLFNFAGILLLLFTFESLKQEVGPDGANPIRKILSRALPWMLLIGTLSMYLGSQGVDLAARRESYPGDWAAGIVLQDALSNYQAAATFIPKAVFPLAILCALALMIIVRTILQHFSLSTCPPEPQDAIS